MVTKEQIDERVLEARRWVATGDELAITVSDRVIAALADERDRLTAELAKLGVERSEHSGEREAELFSKLDQSARHGAFPPNADGSNPLLDRVKEGR